jgi:hypothetical protein
MRSLYSSVFRGNFEVTDETKEVERKKLNGDSQNATTTTTMELVYFSILARNMLPLAKDVGLVAKQRAFEPASDIFAVLGRTVRDSLIVSAVLIKFPAVVYFVKSRFSV